MNPMIRKELLQRMRERRGWLLPSIYLLALGGAVALSYYLSAYGPSFEWAQPQGADIGNVLFVVVSYTQLTILLLLAPVFSAGSLTIEKEQRTISGLLTSLLTPLNIWWGKFAASLLFLLLLLMSALPVLGLSLTLGGVEPRDILTVEGATLLVLASISSVGLYCSAYFRRSLHATAVTYVVVIALVVITYVAMVILTQQWEAKHPRSNEVPAYVVAPLFINPYFAVGAASARGRHNDAGLISLGCFALIGVITAFLALRSIRRSGEQT
jgi:ABC-type transport system involved in multi-copper enzyme maturation permease subunit